MSGPLTYPGRRITQEAASLQLPVKYYQILVVLIGYIRTLIFDLLQLQYFPFKARILAR